MTASFESAIAQRQGAHFINSRSVSTAPAPV